MLMLASLVVALASGQQPESTIGPSLFPGLPTRRPTSAPTSSSRPSTSLPTTVLPSSMPTVPPTLGPPRIEVDAVESPAPGVPVNVTWRCLGGVRNSSVVDVQLRTCAANATNEGRQVGAALNENPIRAFAGSQKWDTSIYEICPSTADGTYVQCVKVQVAESSSTTNDFEGGLSNRVHIDCILPRPLEDDDDDDHTNTKLITFAVQRDLLWLGPLVLLGLIVALVGVFFLCRRRGLLRWTKRASLENLVDYRHLVDDVSLDGDDDDDDDDEGSFRGGGGSLRTPLGTPSRAPTSFAEVFFTFPMWSSVRDDESVATPMSRRSSLAGKRRRPASIFSSSSSFFSGFFLALRRRAAPGGGKGESKEEDFENEASDLDDDDDDDDDVEMAQRRSFDAEASKRDSCFCCWPGGGVTTTPGPPGSSPPPMGVGGGRRRRGSPPLGRSGTTPLSPTSANLRSLVSRGLETATDDWILDYDRLVMGDMVGVGATAAVFRCTYSGATVAAKRVPCYAWDSANKAQLRREAALLARLHHPNVVRFYGVILHAQHAYLITEFIPDTLATRINAYKQKEEQALLLCLEAATKSKKTTTTTAPAAPKEHPRFDDSEFADLVLGTAQGLEYLHNRRVAHRDVKPSNVLCRGREAKLCDFGLSKRADAAYVTNTTGVGTPAFMSPEIITGTGDGLGDGLDDAAPFRAPADVFAFAMLLYCTWTCRLPFEAYDDDLQSAGDSSKHADDRTSSASSRRKRPPLGAFALMSKIAAGERPSLPDDMPPRLGALVSQCWAQATADRPTMTHVLDELTALAADRRRRRQTNNDDQDQDGQDGERTTQRPRNLKPNLDEVVASLPANNKKRAARSHSPPKPSHVSHFVAATHSYEGLGGHSPSNLSLPRKTTAESNIALPPRGRSRDDDNATVVKPPYHSSP